MDNPNPQFVLTMRLTVNATDEKGNTYYSGQMNGFEMTRTVGIAAQFDGDRGHLRPHR